MLTLAPASGAPPVPVTKPLMVVPCACANAGDSPSTAPATARKREILPVIPIQHLAESGTGMRLAVPQPEIGRSQLAERQIFCVDYERKKKKSLRSYADGDNPWHRQPRNGRPGRGSQVSPYVYKLDAG